ncbi:hypothetical protein MAFF212519_27800 [Clavibacter michiganensis]
MGPAIELKWPEDAMKQFSEWHGDGYAVTTEPVVVTPVLLDSGEVRFYRRDVLEEL